MRLANYYTVIPDILWPCASWYAGLYSTRNKAGVGDLEFI
jgi:hypothetical protein